MILGDKECDYETAYFLVNGEHPPIKKCAKGEADIREALEREWYEPDMQYQLWQGCWFGSMDWIQ